MGDLELSIPADTAEGISIPVPLCNDDVLVSVNGQDLGSWPKARTDAQVPSTSSLGNFAVSPSSGDAMNLLLDVTGAHCYRYLSHEYVRYPQNYPAGYTTGIPFVGQRLYAVPGQPDYFLTGAPKSITATGGEAVAIRNQLIESGCSS